MQMTTVKKEDLLAILKVNRDKHRGVFKVAMDAYRRAAMAELEDEIARIESGSNKTVYVSLPAPTDHTADYDTIIHMVEMHQGNTIDLTPTDFMHYVQDDWTWKREFVRTSGTYAPKEVEDVYRVGEF